MDNVCSHDNGRLIRVGEERNRTGVGDSIDASQLDIDSTVIDSIRETGAQVLRHRTLGTRWHNIAVLLGSTSSS
jgi:hypothetical protein